MKSARYSTAAQPFGDTFAVIANALGARRSAPAAGQESVTSRLGRWLMRKQMDGVAPQLARAQDVFERLDHWMWRQQSRQVESYLAGSADVFELERRLRALERGPRGTVL
jgi:hypothetical protein